MKQEKYLVVLLALLVMLSGCADKIDVVFPAGAHQYGFFYGLLHGFIAPFSLLGMLFGADVVVFAANNTGFFYSLGFLLGSGGWGVLASKSKKTVGRE